MKALVVTLAIQMKLSELLLFLASETNVLDKYSLFSILFSNSRRHTCSTSVQGTNTTKITVYIKGENDKNKQITFF